MRKKFNLKGQIIIIFSFVSIITAILFLTFLRLETRKQSVENDRKQQEIFMLDTLNKVDKLNEVSSDYNGYIILKNKVVFKTYNTYIFIDAGYTEKEVVDVLINKPFSFVDEKGPKGDIYFRGTSNSDSTYQIITFTDGKYRLTYTQDINVYVRLSFISIILLGNIIILLWGTILVERINILKQEVNSLSKNEFIKPIEIQGHDELTELSKAIENMRISIEQNEKTKQEILQNVSHDIKTPIAVIKSYAEAIYDGVSDLEDLNIIIKQADILSKKAKQLLQLNRLAYIDNNGEQEKIVLKTMFEQIILQNKYRTEASITLNSDDSVYYGIYENIFIAFSNIVDNAMRYVKTKIIITVKDKKVTIFNDGEPIDKKFIEEGFKPYEKGSKGQFGLGLSISYKTFKYFNLLLEVENINDGVLFTIKPLI